MIAWNLQGLHKDNQALCLVCHGVIQIRVAGGFAMTWQVRNHKVKIAFKFVDEAYPVTGVGTETVNQQDRWFVLLAFTA